MFAALYALALLMVAGGGYAAFAGWEFLLLERGWSMVIAGTTLATGGLVLGGVTAASQALAKRLDALAEATRVASRAQAPAFPKRPTPAEATGAPVARAEPVPPPPSQEIEPKVPKAPQREPIAPAGPAPVAALGIGGVAAEAVAPGATRPPPEPEGGLPPLAVETTPEVGDAGREPEREPEHEPEQEPEHETPIEPSASAEPEEEPERARDEPDRAQPEAPPAPEPIPGAAAIAGPGIEEPVVGRRERGRIEAEAAALSRRLEESAAAFGTRSPSAGAEPPAPEETTDEALERLAVASAEPAPPRTPSEALAEATEQGAGEAGAEADAEPAEEEAEEEAAPADAPEAEDAALGESLDAAEERPGAPVVVGTHVSGANRYVMYSDGSIEAETPEGRLVFGSIDELKGYIASAGQDPTGASQTGPR